MAIDYQQALQLLQAIDHVRDSFGDDEDPGAMLDHIAQLLAEHFNATGCGLLFLGEVSGNIDYLARTGLSEDTLRDLGEQAMTLTRWQALNSPTNAAGTPITLGKEQLGAMVLVRPDHPFDEAEMALLDVAESQVDSAVIQARTIWKMMQRNRELEAIHEIDHLRDYTPNETDLISGFTTSLLKYFQAELCMIILSHSDSGELIVRGVVDKNTLPAQTLETIRQAVERIHETQSLPSPPGFEALHLLAAPLLVSGQRLGGVIVGRTTIFPPRDHRLLTVMTHQMDSAIQYSRVHQQLTQRNRELEAIYRIDQMRDRESDFDALLQQVLTELCNAIAGELGYIMLYTEHEEEPFELKAATSEGTLTSPEYADVIQRFSRQALDSGQLIYDNRVDSGGVRSIVTVPLILNERIIGAFGLVNSHHSHGFSSEDRRLLTAITSQVDTAIFERLERRQLRTLLSRSVDPNVLDYLLQQADATHLLTGERVVLSVLFGDLRGSTAWAERIDPEELVLILNHFLGAMTKIIFKHGGTLDKFVGDEVIGLFGSPLHLEDHAERAAAAALEMQAVHQQLIADFDAQGRELPPLGVGIGSGEVITGEFGPPIRTDFTAMGNAVNLGARLCSAAGAGQIFISDATYTIIKQCSQVNILEPLDLKGISQPAPAYELLTLKDC